MSPASTSMASYTVVPADSPTDLSHFVDIITHAFSTTALTTAFIIDKDGAAPPSGLIPTARREQHFAQGILDSAASNAELVHAGNWSAIALWESPTFQGKAFIDSRARPSALLSEWRGRVKAAKAKYLAAPSNPSTDSESISSTNSEPQSTSEPRIRPFYHLSFLARNPSVPRVPGSINAVIAPFLDRARAEKAPVWLEATTSRAVKLYESFGFRVAEEIVIGKGKVDSQGWPTADGQGEGVTAWAMIYDSHLSD